MNDKEIFCADEGNVIETRIVINLETKKAFRFLRKIADEIEEENKGKGKLMNEDDDLNEDDDGPFKEIMDKYVSILRENKV